MSLRLPARLFTILLNSYSTTWLNALILWSTELHRNPSSSGGMRSPRHQDWPRPSTTPFATTQSRPPGLALDVHAEEFTKHQEKVAGADLYISVVRKDKDDPISKGMLVQTKRREAMLRSGEPQRLGNQCKQMYRRSKKSSYVWIYERDRVRSVKAPQASKPILQHTTGSSSVGELIADGLRCNKGDDKIGRELSAEPAEGILEVMKRLSVPNGLDFVVRQD